MRILVIDRDDQFRFWARGLFKQQHVGEVVSAPHASDGHDMVCRHDIHIVLVEFGLDAAGGLSFLKWLRDKKASPCPDVPVVLMAKALDREQLRQACAFGIHGMLRKPMSGEVLLKTVAAVCGNPRRIPFSGEVKPPSVPVPPSAPQPPPVKLAVRQAHGGALPGAAVRAGGGGGGLAGGGGGGGRAMGGGPIGGLEGAPQAAVKPKGFLEPLEPPPAPAAPSDDAGWGEALAAAPCKAAAVGLEPIELAKPVRKKPQFSDEPPPAAKSKPDAEAGVDIDGALEDHANWVRSSGVQGRKAKLEGEDLSGRSLVDALLNNVLLRHSDLSGCDCTNAQMQGADLRHAEIMGGILIGANLAVVRLRHAKLRGCQFDHANLKGADLAGADLTESKFGDADLTGANLLGADLSGADLSGVSGLTQAQMEDTTGDGKTRLPPGLFLAPPRGTLSEG